MILHPEDDALRDALIESRAISAGALSALSHPDVDPHARVSLVEIAKLCADRFDAKKWTEFSLKNYDVSYMPNVLHLRCDWPDTISIQHRNKLDDRNCYCLRTLNNTLSVGLLNPINPIVEDILEEISNDIQIQKFIINFNEAKEWN